MRQHYVALRALICFNQSGKIEIKKIVIVMLVLLHIPLWTVQKKHLLLFTSFIYYYSYFEFKMHMVFCCLQASTQSQQMRKKNQKSSNCDVKNYVDGVQKLGQSYGNDI